MLSFRAVAVVVMSLVLAGCSSVDTATRNAPSGVPSDLVVTNQTPVHQKSYDVQSVSVHVPETLSVSEAHRYLPKADIVWRGDPPGNRYEQIKTIFETAMLRGVGYMPKGTRPVTLDVEVTRFHALTEKARYSVGGVHAIEFLVTLRDPDTGAALNAPHLVVADLKAYGGQTALRAEARGETQKVRITAHLAQVIEEELTRAGGHKAERHGFLGLLNKI